MITKEYLAVLPRNWGCVKFKTWYEAKTYLIDLDKGICNVLGTKKKTKHLKKNTPTV